jgi:hypothetical protein
MKTQTIKATELIKNEQANDRDVQRRDDAVREVRV